MYLDVNEIQGKSNVKKNEKYFFKLHIYIGKYMKRFLINNFKILSHANHI
jgi:hypothetical protein